MKTEVQSLFGVVLKTFGTNGELMIKLAKDVSDPSLKEPVYIIIDGIQVPFFFNTYQTKGNRAIVVFDNMETEALASELLGCEMRFVKPANTKQKVKINHLIGCKVIDRVYGELGTVTEYFEYPANHCLEVEYNNRLILIPVIDSIVINVNLKTKTIETQVPEGLIEI